MLFEVFSDRFNFYREEASENYREGADLMPQEDGDTASRSQLVDSSKQTTPIQQKRRCRLAMKFPGSGLDA